MSSRNARQRWYRRRQLFASRAPENLQDWLFDPASLTARLLRKCPGKFRVELLSQTLELPMLDEMRVLGMRQRKLALVRQVKLYCGDHAVVYARTVIPVTTLTGRQRCYANLGNRPLGAMLFADRSMQRDEVMVSKLKPVDRLHQKTGASADTIWGRRSVFRVGGKALLVSEYYLPALFE